MSDGVALYIREEVGTQRYGVGTDTPKLMRYHLRRRPAGQELSGCLSLPPKIPDTTIADSLPLCFLL